MAIIGHGGFNLANLTADVPVFVVTRIKSTFIRYAASTVACVMQF